MPGNSKDQSEPARSTERLDAWLAKISGRIRDGKCLLYKRGPDGVLRVQVIKVNSP
jgi:hypothetical protein